MKYFKLPDLGEGLQEAEIVEWHIKVGDTVSADQTIVSVETAKAIVDVPSPQAGKIAALFGKAGDLVHIGEPLVEFAGENDDSGTVVGKMETAGDDVRDLAQGVVPHRIGARIDLLSEQDFRDLGQVSIVHAHDQLAHGAERDTASAEAVIPRDGLGRDRFQFGEREVLESLFGGAPERFGQGCRDSCHDELLRRRQRAQGGAHGGG